MPPVNCCHALLQPLAKNVSSNTAGSIWATDVPGWITAVGTALLAVFAILTTIYAVRAFRKQSQEVSDQASMLEVQSEQLAEQRKVNAEQIRVLALQADELRESLEERKRDALAQRRAQASRVFFSTKTGRHVTDAEGPDTREDVAVYIKNSSEQPVYDITINWHQGTAPLSGPHHIAVLMPGGETISNRLLPADLPTTVDRTLFGAVARFRDAAGVQWRLRPDGQLDEEPPTE